MVVFVALTCAKLLEVANHWRSIGGFVFRLGGWSSFPFKALDFLVSFLILILIQKKHYVCQMNLLHFLFPLISSFLICCLVFLS